MLGLRVRLKQLPIATVSLYASVDPMMAVIPGVLILRESFNVRMLLAAAVVFADRAVGAKC